MSPPVATKENNHDGSSNHQIATRLTFIEHRLTTVEINLELFTSLAVEIRESIKESTRAIAELAHQKATAVDHEARLRKSEGSLSELAGVIKIAHFVGFPTLLLSVALLIYNAVKGF